MSSIDRNKIKKLLDSAFIQKPKEYTIYANTVVSLELLKDEIYLKDVVVDKDSFNTIVAFVITIGNTRIPFSLVHRANVFYDAKGKIDIESDEPIILTYTKGQKIMTLLPTTDDLKGTLKKVTGMLYNSGGQVTRAENVPIALSNIPAYKNMDYLHLEVVAANMERNAKDDSEPWRIKQTGKPIVYGMKNIAYAENELVGLSFENAGKAIANGLIKGNVAHGDNMIEKEILLDF